MANKLLKYNNTKILICRCIQNQIVQKNNFSKFNKPQNKNYLNLLYFTSYQIKRFYADDTNKENKLAIDWSKLPPLPLCKENTMTYLTSGSNKLTCSNPIITKMAAKSKKDFQPKNDLGQQQQLFDLHAPDNKKPKSESKFSAFKGYFSNAYSSVKSVINNVQEVIVSPIKKLTKQKKEKMENGTFFGKTKYKYKYKESSADDKPSYPPGTKIGFQPVDIMKDIPKNKKSSKLPPQQYSSSYYSNDKTTSSPPLSSSTTTTTTTKIKKAPVPVNLPSISLLNKSGLSFPIIDNSENFLGNFDALPGRSIMNTVRDRFHGVPNNHIIVVDGMLSNQGLVAGDFEFLLKSNSALTSNLVDVYLTKLKMRNQFHHFPTVGVCQTPFGQSLLNDMPHEEFIETFQEKNLLDNEILLVPIITGNALGSIENVGHYTLLVVDFGKRKMVYLDSLGSSGYMGHPGLVSNVRRYIEYFSKIEKNVTFDWSDWCQFAPKNLPKQIHGLDCGVFLCKFADCYSRRVPLLFSNADIDYIRYAIGHQLLNWRFN